MRIGDVEIPHATKASESGGMNSPSKRTDKGFSYTSHVGAESISATVEAMVEPSTYSDLAQMRDSSEPFSVVVGVVHLGACTLDDLSVDQSSSTISHYSVTIKITQVQQAETGTATLTITATDASGDGTTKSGSSDLQDATLIPPEEQSTGNRENPDESDPLGDISGWLGM